LEKYPQRQLAGGLPYRMHGFVAEPEWRHSGLGSLL